LKKETATHGRKFIPALTGLRAFCAYGIFFYHLNPFSKEAQPSLFTLFDQFYSFIPFFFVISGFVIFYNYYKPGGYSKNEWYNYFVSRFARIFPILIILNTAYFALCYRDHIYNAVETIKLYLLNITLLKGFFADYFFTGIVPSWTNSVEEVFYLLAPLLFLFSKKRWILIKFVLLFYALGFILTCIFINVPFHGFLSSFRFTAYFTFFGRVFEFTAGIYLALLFMNMYKNKWLEKVKQFTLPIGFLLLAFLYALLCNISSQYHVAHANEVWQGILINNLLFPVAIFFILYSFLYCKSIVQKMLSSKIMVALGNSTYSFYLLHTSFILSYIRKYISKNVFIVFVVMIIVSFIFYKLVEQPIAKFLKRKLYRKPATTQLSSSINA